MSYKNVRKNFCGWINKDQDYFRKSATLHTQNNFDLSYFQTKIMFSYYCLI